MKPSSYSHFPLSPFFLVFEWRSFFFFIKKNVQHALRGSFTFVGGDRLGGCSHRPATAPRSHVLQFLSSAFKVRCRSQGHVVQRFSVLDNLISTRPVQTACCTSSKFPNPVVETTLSYVHWSIVSSSNVHFRWFDRMVQEFSRLSVMELLKKYAQ